MNGAPKRHHSGHFGNHARHVLHVFDDRVTNDEIERGISKWQPLPCGDHERNAFLHAVLDHGQPDCGCLRVGLKSHQHRARVLTRQRETVEAYRAPDLQDSLGRDALNITCDSLGSLLSTGEADGYVLCKIPTLKAIVDVTAV